MTKDRPQGLTGSKLGVETAKREDNKPRASSTIERGRKEVDKA